MGLRGCRSLLLAQGEEMGGLVSPCARRPRHTRKRGHKGCLSPLFAERAQMGWWLFVSLARPRRHTRSIVFLGCRCSLKRAVGDESTTIFKRQQASSEGAFKRSRTSISPRPKREQASLEGAFLGGASCEKRTSRRARGLGG